MPIELIRIEEGVLLQRLVGVIKLSEMQSQQKEGFAMMKAAGDSQMVLVTDASQLVSTTNDVSITQLKKILEFEKGFVTGYVFLSSSLTLRVSLSVVARMVGLEFMFAPDHNTALIAARRILAKKASPHA